MSAEDCAEAIVKAIVGRKDEVVVGKGLSKLAPIIQRIAPGYVRKMMAKR